MRTEPPPSPTCSRCRSHSEIAAKLDLSDLDRKILIRLLDGDTDDTVAANLNTSTRTVRRRMAHLAGRLNVRGRIALVAAVVQLGLIRVDIMDTIEQLEGLL